MTPDEMRENANDWKALSNESGYDGTTLRIFGLRMDVWRAAAELAERQDRIIALLERLVGEGT